MAIFPQSGWYHDPGSFDKERFWTGHSWTEHWRPLAQPQEPLQPPQPPRITLSWQQIKPQLPAGPEPGLLNRGR